MITPTSIAPRVEEIPDILSTAVLALGPIQGDTIEEHGLQLEYANLAARKLIQVASDAPTERRSLTELVSPDVAAILAEIYRTVPPGERLVVPDGELGEQAGPWEIQHIRGESIRIFELRSLHGTLAGSSHSALEELTDAFMTVDAQGQILFANAATAPLFELDGEHLVGHDLWTAIPDLDTQDMHRALQKVLIGRAERRVRLRAASIDRWLDIDLHPAPSGSHLVVRDIDSEFRADRLERHLATGSTVLDGRPTPEALRRWLGDTVVPTLASSAVVALPFLPEDDLGPIATWLRSWTEKLIESPGDLSSIRPVPHDLLTHAAVPWAGVEEVERALREHNARWVMLSPIRYGAKLLGTAMIIRQARQRTFSRRELGFLRRLCRRLAGAAEMSRLFMDAQDRERRSAQANDAKDYFLAAVSHELRSPLNVILGWTAMLKRGELNAERTQHALTVVERNARSQLRLVEDLLDMSQIVSGRAKLHLSVVDVSDTASSVVGAIQPEANRLGISLRAEVEPGCVTLGDADRLRQVLTNLVRNALKFSNNGGEVRVCVAAEQSRVRMRVEDTGQGFDPETAEQLFERFHRGKAHRDQRIHGLGLGLAITKHLVELHRGEIWAQSRGVGHGATFTVDLPVVAVAASARADVDPDQERVDLSGLRVLVVDDEEDARELVATILVASGANVTAVGNGAEALTLIRAQPFDLLVSDVGMPEMDGLALLRTIRQFERGTSTHLPALALTAYAASKDRTRVLRSGFDAYVAKPVETSELLVVAQHTATRSRR